MKTVMKGSLVKRVDDLLARNLTSHHGFKYVPKHVWKEAKVVAGKRWRTVEGVQNAVD